MDSCLHISLLFEADENECPIVNIHPDDVVCLPFSSGTTGLPKGVMLTHKSLLSSVSQQVDGHSPNLNITNEDSMMCVLPMYHIYSLNSIMLCGLRVGATLVTMAKFDLHLMLELIQKYKVPYHHALTHPHNPQFRIFFQLLLVVYFFFCSNLCTKKSSIEFQVNL